MAQDNLSMERLQFCYLGAGTLRVHKRCIRCLNEADFLHRVDFLNCANKCILCGTRGHIGQVCLLMLTKYREFFNRQWWASHADLPWACPDEGDGLEVLRQAARVWTGQNFGQIPEDPRGRQAPSPSRERQVECRQSDCYHNYPLGIDAGDPRQNIHSRHSQAYDEHEIGFNNHGYIGYNAQYNRHQNGNDQPNIDFVNRAQIDRRHIDRRQNENDMPDTSFDGRGNTQNSYRNNDQIGRRSDRAQRSQPNKNRVQKSAPPQHTQLPRHLNPPSLMLLDHMNWKRADRNEPTNPVQDAQPAQRLGAMSQMRRGGGTHRTMKRRIRRGRARASAFQRAPVLNQQVAGTRAQLKRHGAVAGESVLNPLVVPGDEDREDEDHDKKDEDEVGDDTHYDNEKQQQWKPSYPHVEDEDEIDDKFGLSDEETMIDD